MFVGLVRDPGRDWRPPDDNPEPSPRRSWSLEWRLVVRVLAWVGVVAAMFALAPVVSDVVGTLAGYLLILAAVAVGVWRVDRWCARQYWRGLKDYNS